MPVRAISASSIELWTMCRRRWAFSYLKEYRGPEGAATTAGKLVHALLAEAFDDEPALVPSWTTTTQNSLGDTVEVTYDLSRMARELWKHNPRDLAIAWELEWTRTLFGVEFKGIIDRLSEHYVLDYKTTGGSLKYSKTPSKLKKDVQRLLYSQAYPGSSKALWITGTWGNSEGAIRAGDVIPYKSQVALLARDEQRDTENFKLFVLTPAEEIACVSPGTDPLSFPLPDNAFSPYDSPCKKFAPEGCPHYKTCHKPRLAGALAMRESAVSLIEALRAETPENDLVLMPAAMPDPDPTPRVLIENLYIDCVPLFATDEPIVYGYTLLERVSREVENDTGLKHVMLAKYAEGGPMLAAELLSQLEQAPHIKHLFLESKYPKARAVMETLAGRSRNVYRGIV